MDSYKLRQEISELQKTLAETKRQQSISDRLVNDLHQEQMKYLQEIPVYKKQASDAQQATIEPLKQLAELNKKVLQANKEYNALQNAIVESKETLDKLIAIQHRTIKETCEIKESTNSAVVELKERESSVENREKDCVSKELFNKSVESVLDKREVAIANKEKEISDKSDELKQHISNHENNVDAHCKKVDSLIEQKQFLSEDQQILKEKSESLNKILKDNSDIKSAMLKQSEKMDAEIKKAEQKQSALDRAILDLKNEEKRIKIMELKVFKLTKDANIEKELKDLMESLK